MTTLPENVSQLSKLIPKPEKDLACQNLIQLSGVSRHGFLRKMPDSWSGRFFDSFLNRKWSSKFVVLRNGCVYIYGSEVASCCDRAYSLFGFQDVLDCGTEVYKAGKWAFQVVDALGDQDRDRSLFFSANSEDDKSAWIESFQNEIMKGNIMMFDSVSSVTKPKLRAASTQRKALPTLSEEVKVQMRASMNIASNVNFCREETDSSSDECNMEDEKVGNAKYTGKSRALPPVPDEPSLPSSRLKADTPAVATKPRPQPKPAVNVKPVSTSTVNTVTSVPNKHARGYPLFPDVSSSPLSSNQKQTCKEDNAVQFARRTPEQSQSNAVVDGKPKPPIKPINTVKPLGVQPEKKNNVSPVSQLGQRKVPQPPEFVDVPRTKPKISNSQLSSLDCSAGYEIRSECLAEYEQWDPRERCMVDPLVKASYWQQDADEALKVMRSIKEDGAFLIRDATEGIDYKTLMVSMSEVDSSVRKYKIIKESSLYTLQLGKSGFKSLQELLEYYQQNSLPNRATKLTKPYSQVWKTN